jgi:hypothetical protein
MSAASPPSSPVRVWARIDAPQRWSWLYKWFLAIPHLVVLVFLWLAFAVLTVAAWFSIVFTGRYPRGIFDFNVGVLRWSWRVQLYAFTFSTDRYPAFSLAPDPDFPGEIEVAYPEQLSRGLVWVKSWLLAIPHLVLLAIFLGGAEVSGGLIGFLSLIAAVTLAVRKEYPPSLFDLIMGLHRWCWRVVAYVALMRDEYPPFRLDMGPDEAEPPVLAARPTHDPAAPTAA